MSVPALPPLRGTLVHDRPLADLTWLRVGGPADIWFQPADEDDLAAFLRALPPEVPTAPMIAPSRTIGRPPSIGSASGRRRPISRPRAPRC